MGATGGASLAAAVGSGSIAPANFRGFGPLSQCNGSGSGRGAIISRSRSGARGCGLLALFALGTDGGRVGLARSRRGVVFGRRSILCRGDRPPSGLWQRDLCGMGFTLAPLGRSRGGAVAPVGHPSSPLGHLQSRRGGRSDAGGWPFNPVTTGRSGTAGPAARLQKRQTRPRRAVIAGYG